MSCEKVCPISGPCGSREPETYMPPCALSARRGVWVCRVLPAYSYRETVGEHTGFMVEQVLDQEYLCETYGEGVDAAIRWAQDRYVRAMRLLYDGCFLSSLKVCIRYIAPISADGTCCTSCSLPFFSWRYDSGYSLVEARDKWFSDTELVGRSIQG